MTTEAINSKKIKEKTKRKKKPKINTKKENRDLLFIVISLYIIGLVFILSSSSANLVIKNEDPFYFVKKQLIFGAISMIPFCMAYFINIKNILKQDKLIFIASILILLLVLLFGKDIKGNKNWLVLGPMSLQPSEFVKISLIICSSVYLRAKVIDKEVLKKAIFIMIVLVGLVVVQGDLGTVIIMSSISLFILFIAGTSLKFLGTICIFGLLGLAVAIMKAPFRMKRIAIFLNPFQDYYGMGYQIIQSLFCMANGGFFGRGIYESVQKYGFLPENHTDFIFSIIVEEVGFVGAAILLSLFVLLVTKIFKIAYSLKEKEYTIIVSGIGCLIAIEALLNLGVTVSLLPVAGVTLPFVSYGGSSLMSKITAIAIVLNINKNCEKLNEDDIVNGKKKDIEYRKNKTKKIKQDVKSFKNITIAKIKIFITKMKKNKKRKIIIDSKNCKKDNFNFKENYTINKDEREFDLDNMKIENIFFTNNKSKIDEEKMYNNFNNKLKKRNSYKIDVKNILSNATRTKTKVVNIDNTSGLKEIKISKKKVLFSLNKNSEIESQDIKINKISK